MKLITILITSPEGYSERLKAALEVYNKDYKPFFNVICLPTISTQICPNCPEMIEFLHAQDCYDYAFFASRKAIDSMREALQQQQVVLSKKIGYCAAGEDIKYMCEQLGVLPTFIPTEPSPMGIVEELKKDEANEGKRIAILAPNIIGMKEPPTIPQLMSALEKTTMIANRIPAYVTSKCNKGQIKKIASLLQTNFIDCIAFSSGGEIQSLIDGLNALTPPVALPSSLTVACFGPYTAACAKELGVDVQLVSQDFSSFEGFAEALEKYFD